MYFNAVFSPLLRYIVKKVIIKTEYEKKRITPFALCNNATRCNDSVSAIHYAPYQYDLEDMNMLPKSVFGMRDNGESLLFSENEIKGFSYEEGYVYVLRIKATPTLQQVGTCNPPPYTFELVEVISKKQPKIGPAI